MKEIAIRPYDPGELPALLTVWEDAVRASHHFLAESDIVGIRPEVVQAFACLEVWVAEAGGRAAGFMGMHGDMVEMLFIAPESMGTGLGTALLEKAQSLREGRALRVDVNEQNPAALAFYLSRGFRVTGRSGVDGAGRPFPLLHLERVSRSGMDV